MLITDLQQIKKMIELGYIIFKYKGQLIALEPIDFGQVSLKYQDDNIVHYERNKRLRSDNDKIILSDL